MTTDYDPIAEQYRRAKQQAWRLHIEAFSLMSLIGDATGKSVFVSDTEVEPIELATVVVSLTNRLPRL